MLPWSRGEDAAVGDTGRDRVPARCHASMEPRRGRRGRPGSVIVSGLPFTSFHGAAARTPRSAVRPWREGLCRLCFHGAAARTPRSAGWTGPSSAASCGFHGAAARTPRSGDTRGCQDAHADRASMEPRRGRRGRYSPREKLFRAIRASMEPRRGRRGRGCAPTAAVLCASCFHGAAARTPRSDANVILAQWQCEASMEPRRGRRGRPVRGVHRAELDQASMEPRRGRRGRRRPSRPL